MKKTLIVLTLLLISGQAIADQYVNGYYKDNGTYVQPYYRSNSNSTQYDNYSTKGNTNPYTGSQGTINVNTPQHNYGYNYGNGNSNYKKPYGY